MLVVFVSKRVLFLDFEAILGDDVTRMMSLRKNTLFFSNLEVP